MTLVVPKAIDWDNLKVPVWQRLPGETSRAFHCWQVYRDMPNNERSIENAAEKLGITAYALRDQYTRWHWKRRLEAWENYLSDIAIKQQIEASADMNRRHIETSRTMLEKAMLRLTGREPDSEGRGGIAALPVESLSATDIKNLVDSATKLERLAIEAEAQRLGIREREERRDNVVEIRLAFDATPVMPGKQTAVPPVFHGHDEEDAVDAEFTEIGPDELESPKGDAA